MATSSSKDIKAADNAVKHNIAPQPKPTRDPLDHDGDGKKGGVATEPTPEELAADNERRIAEERQREEAAIKDSRKGTPIDGLSLPEKQGEVLWQTGVRVGTREAGEKDKDYDQRWTDAETTIVSQALNVMSGPGGLRPNGYQLVKDESNGILRLNLVSADPEYPDPARVGGLPNADGKY